MTNKRQAPRTVRCIWCSKIRSGAAWLNERRRFRSEPTVQAVCQRCKSFYLTGFDLEGFMDWCRKEIR